MCNGNERAIRLLIAPKRNHVMGIARPSFKNRGSTFTQFATVIRCCRPDGTSQTVALHLLSTGGANLRVTISKQEFFVPVVMLLKALQRCSDRDIYNRAIGGDQDDSYVSDRLVTALREHAAFDEKLHTREQCVGFLGSRFRPVMRAPTRLSNVQVRSSPHHPISPGPTPQVAATRPPHQRAVSNRLSTITRPSPDHHPPVARPSPDRHPTITDRGPTPEPEPDSLVPAATRPARHLGGG